MSTRRVTRLSSSKSQQAADSDTLPRRSTNPPPMKRIKLQNGEGVATKTKEVEAEREDTDDQEVGLNQATEKPPLPALKKGKGKSKALAKDADPDRTQFLHRRDTPWKIGAHVSAAGGVEFAVVNAATIGANAFALFLKSQRKWTSPALTDHSISEFKKRMKEYGYESRHVLPHGSYLINLGNPDAEKREKSYECFLDDLKRCELLGLELYNFHPGSTVGATTLETSIALIGSCINRAHRETKRVTIVLENMAGAGNIIGGDFRHLAEIIKLVDDKTRVGVCLDTCHAFAAGYDIRTKEGWDETMQKFSETIGLSYLRAFHLNDSLCELSSRKDRHQNIGLGELGLGAFHHIVNDERTKGLPMVLETPSFEMPKEVWGVEIDALGRMCPGASEGDVNRGQDLEKRTEEIKVAVKDAESRSGKAQKKKAKKEESDVKKRKKQNKGRDNDSSCEHE